MTKSEYSGQNRLMHVHDLIKGVLRMLLVENGLFLDCTVPILANMCQIVEENAGDPWVKRRF